MNRATNSTPEWLQIWNDRAGIENPVEVSAYTVNGVPETKDEHDRVVDSYLELLHHNREHSVLEIGCGNGLNLARLEGHCARLVGTDFSSDVVARYQGDASIFVSQANALPTMDGSFDRVLMASVAHYFPNLQYLYDSLAEIGRILRREGEPWWRIS